MEIFEIRRIKMPTILIRTAGSKFDCVSPDQGVGLAVSIYLAAIVDHQGGPQRR